LVELRVVVPAVAGSSPVAHPQKYLQITAFKVLSEGLGDAQGGVLSGVEEQAYIEAGL
jgi:hypothetical protein